jgi:hypothetical protein
VWSWRSEAPSVPLTSRLDWPYLTTRSLHQTSPLEKLCGGPKERHEPRGAAEVPHRLRPLKAFQCFHFFRLGLPVFSFLSPAPLSSSQASYPFMGNCCSGTATVPSEHATTPPQATERATPAPVPPQPSTEEPPVPLPVPSPQLPSGTRSRTTSRPESIHHRRVGVSFPSSSQDLNPRSRTRSAPQRAQPPTASTSALPQNRRIRAETLSEAKRNGRSEYRPMKLGE